MESRFSGFASQVGVLKIRERRSRVFNTKGVRLIGRMSFIDSWPRLPAFRMKAIHAWLQNSGNYPKEMQLR